MEEEVDSRDPRYRPPFCLVRKAAFVRLHLPPQTSPPCLGRVGGSTPQSDPAILIFIQDLHDATGTGISSPLPSRGDVGTRAELQGGDEPTLDARQSLFWAHSTWNLQFPSQQRVPIPEEADQRVFVPSPMSLFRRALEFQAHRPLETPNQEMPSSPHPRSISGFLATARRALAAPKGQRPSPLYLVVGNEAAGKEILFLRRRQTLFVAVSLLHC
jgi:hypothetical protein